MQEQEKDLFAGYEIKNWNITTRIYKIIGASAIINLLLVFTMAQGNLLTRKGCDSPLVGSICQVLDTLVVGSSLLGTDSEFVSKDFDEHELADADITYIDVSNDAPPLKYPEGYFALANPEQFQAQQDALAMTTMPEGFGGAFPSGGFSGATAMPPASGSTDLLGSTPNLPPVNPSPIIGDLPTSTSGSNPISSYPKPRRNKGFPKYVPKYVKPKRSPIIDDSPKELPKLGGDETAKNNADKPKPVKTPEAQKSLDSEKVAEVEINKKPFEVLGDDLNAKLEKKEIDLNKPFFVVLDATITADNKFDTNPKKSKFVKYEGDPAMIDVAKQAMQSVGDSGILGYLKNLGVDKVNFTLVQDENQIYAIIKSDQKTPEKARTIASGFNTLLKLLVIGHDTGAKKLDENSVTLLKNSKVVDEGKNFVFNFAIPKPLAQDLIKKTLADRAEKKNNSQPNSNGLSQNTSK